MKNVPAFWSTALAALLASPAFGFTAPVPLAKSAAAAGPEAPGLGIRVLRPELAPASVGKGRGALLRERDARSGAVRIFAGGDLLSGSAAFAPLAGDEAFIGAAHRFIETYATEIGVEASDLRLEPNAVLRDSDVQFYQFHVYRGGLRIEDASLDFRFKQGKLLQVSNQSFAEAKADTRPGLAGLDAIAAGQLLAEHAEPLGEHLRVTAADAGYQLVRVAQFDVRTATARWLVQVEAATGRVFEIRPTTFHLEGRASGHVYPRYYKEDLVKRPYGALTLSAGAVDITTDAKGIFDEAPNTSRPQLDGFIGPFVKIGLRSGTKVTRAGEASADGTWQVVFEKTGTDAAAADKNVAQSHVFYHTNAMVAQAKKYIAAPWLSRQLTANVNLTQSCNAHWDGSTINFYSAGNGCANTGLIADVVYHEWGHGLDDNTGGIADGAFSEGFGDIMSLLMTQSNLLGIGFKSDGTPVRDLEPNKVYPRDSGEVHAEGLIIGSTFYDLYKSLVAKSGKAVAVDTLSRYAFKMIYTARRYTDVYNALLVIDDDNADLTDKTPNFCALNKAFSDHGLAKADASCARASMGPETADTAGAYLPVPILDGPA